jgi:stage II sporulation protein D
MKPDSSPSIEVGIVQSDVIRFTLKGEFTLAGNNSLPSGEGNLLLSGEAVAGLNGEGIWIRCGVRFLQGSGTLFLEPVDPSAGRFTLHKVVIGVGFHWEQQEDQEFCGVLKLMASGGKIQVVNIISLEAYLVSVISSEMRGDSSLELLKAHTVISRSWLLAQVEKQRTLAREPSVYVQEHRSEKEYIRWYDREDHTGFHVCADDHCQRYQGITRAHNPQVERAVRETTGTVLVFDGKICDARFSKCCGGVSETFESCWEPVSHPYLQRVDDNPITAPVNTADLTIEPHAQDFIHSSPSAFCNTRDPRLLRQVLNDYDLASPDFYRWRVSYSQEEIGSLIREKSGIDFGQILDLVPVERGHSARLIRLRIVGSGHQLTIGKELEIRRWLSPSHLYSSAFTVEKEDVTKGVPGRFTLTGAGWGHGVGLCQIGAAVMADRGYSHREILGHYFVDTKLEKRYEDF